MQNPLQTTPRSCACYVSTHLLGFDPDVRIAITLRYRARIARIIKHPCKYIGRFDKRFFEFWSEHAEAKQAGALNGLSDATP